MYLMDERNAMQRTMNWLRPALINTSIAGAVSFVALCCSASVGAETVDQLYAMAKAEKRLVMWAAAPTESYERAARAFEQQFPGVIVSLVSGFSSVLKARIEDHARTKEDEIDLVIIQTVQYFILWESRGLLLQFRPESFDKIEAGYKDKEGAWIALNKTPSFYGYNTQNVKPEEVPRSAIDFLNSRFRGRLISAYPADDDISLYVFSGIVRQYGWGYMDHYLKQLPKFVPDHLDVARSLGSGESFASFDNTLSGSLDVERESGKIALAGPADDFLPVLFTAEAILKDAPHPNAAKLFVTWFLSKEWQSRPGAYSSRRDIATPDGLLPLSKYRLMDHYLEFVSNENQLTALRNRFKSYTGPVERTGGGTK